MANTEQKTADAAAKETADLQTRIEQAITSGDWATLQALQSEVTNNTTLPPALAAQFKDKYAEVEKTQAPQAGAMAGNATIPTAAGDVKIAGAVAATEQPSSGTGAVAIAGSAKAEGPGAPEGAIAAASTASPQNQEAAAELLKRLGLDKGAQMGGRPR